MKKLPILITVLLLNLSLFYTLTPPTDTQASSPLLLPTPTITTTTTIPIQIEHRHLGLPPDPEQSHHWNQQRPAPLILAPKKPTKPPPSNTASPLQISITSAITNSWITLLNTDFEEQSIVAPCKTYSSSTAPNATWGVDDFNPLNSSYAIWPAISGSDAVDPALSPYPPNLRSWLICGPFALTTAKKIVVDFAYWLDIPDPDDYFFFGYSEDPFDISAYQWWHWSEQKPWSNFKLILHTIPRPSQLWVAWVFQSDDDNDQGQGVWLDDLAVARYNEPLQVCGNVDNGNKGVIIPAYEKAIDADDGQLKDFPTIRPGDELIVDGLVDADSSWVRLVFKTKNGVLDLRDYDHIVDKLCAAGISVLAVINHQSLVRQDFNDPTVAEAYRHEFTSTVETIVNYFDGRISHYEIWNEPDLNPTQDAQNPAPPFIEESLYAHLLNNSYNTIKAINPEIKVLFGGLSSPYGGLDYLTKVYAVWENQLGDVSPFDILALHPYFDLNNNTSLDPTDYFYDINDNLISNGILNKMFDEGDGDKKIWITEIGWNSAPKNHPDIDCWDNQVVTPLQQAIYLQSSFDILFNEVVFTQTNTLAIEKVFWYQVMDVGINNDLACPEVITSTMRGFVSSGYVPPEYTAINAHLVPPVPWEFGLYSGDKRRPKPAQCAFRHYPKQCAFVYTPFIISGGHVTK